MAKLQCDQCGNVNKITISDEILGLSIKVKCKHAGCHNLIPFKVPTKLGRDDDQTVFSVAGERIDAVGFRILKNEYHAQSELTLVAGRHTLGRNSGSKKASIQINTADHSISRIHCELDIFRDQKGQLCCTIKDAGSQAGVLLNDRKLHELDEYYLEDKDQIRMGQSIIEYQVNHKLK